MVRRLCTTLLVLLSAAGEVVCESEQFYVAKDLAQEPLQVQNKTVGDCHQACRYLLASDHADLITNYPDLPPGLSKKFFEAQQGEKSPVCSVEPRSADAVSLVVKTVRQHQCSFAVKSGGHGTAANIADGILLDLSLLDDVVLSEDKETAAVGPGARWGDVYDTLAPHGHAVVGGRVPAVGVGGFLMGGGVSFLTPQLGWGFDNIRSFEVVLPDGTIANASSSSLPDIYFALRGGGSSFGIVTRFQLETVPGTPLWGSMSFNFANDITEREEKLGIQEKFLWTLDSVAITASTYAQRLAFSLGFGLNTTELIDTVVDVNLAKDLEVVPQAYVVLVWVPFLKAYLAGSIYYSPHDGGNESPTALKNVSALPMLISAPRQGNMPDFAEEQRSKNPVSGSRHSWWTATFKLDSELLREIWDIFIIGTNDLRHHVPDAMISNSVQFLLQDQIANGASRGGNAFGLKVEDGPLFMFSITVEYYKAKDDEKVRQACSSIISQAVELGKRKQLYHRFLYPNYANSDQDIFAGFAPENLQRLAEIQERYDPGRVFARLQPNSRAFGSQG